MSEMIEGNAMKCDDPCYEIELAASPQSSLTGKKSNSFSHKKGSCT